MKLARAQTRQFTKNHSFKPSARTMSATIEFVLVMTITKVQVLRFLSSLQRSVPCNSINGASSKEGGAGEASHQSSPLKCIALPLQDILSLSLAVMLTQNSQMNPDKEGSCRMVQIPSPHFLCRMCKSHPREVCSESWQKTRHMFMGGRE